MEIKQFEDKNLAHYSYAILSRGELALIDPSRDPQPYYDFATHNNAKITAVIETHPHADFVSSHLEILQNQGAVIYTSKLSGADYPHRTFDEGDGIMMGDVQLKALNTPGHSPDSISVVLIDEAGNEYAVFTGDTLFIGDCGRPDLREHAGAITATKNALAAQMYHSLRDKLMPLPESTLIYPAHGAGSLCGKNLGTASSSTIGLEKTYNWSLQNMPEQEFIDRLLSDLPFVPKYFPFDVGINKKGAEAFHSAIDCIVRHNDKEEKLDLNPEIPLIDTRPQAQFKKAHSGNAINLMNDKPFETWLGSIISPGEKFYLLAESSTLLTEMIERTARIGYEKQLAAGIGFGYGSETMNSFDSSSLRGNEMNFTIIDVRNPSEVSAQQVFANAINIPLYELRERLNEVPLDKPVLVHCAGGYRSAAGSSIIQSKLRGKLNVYDLGEDVKLFLNNNQ